MRNKSISEEEFAEASELIEEISEEERRERGLMAKFMLVFSPIQFEGPCILRVRAQTESGELRGMGLKIERIPQSK